MTSTTLYQKFSLTLLVLLVALFIGPGISISKIYAFHIILIGMLVFFPKFYLVHMHTILKNKHLRYSWAFLILYSFIPFLYLPFSGELLSVLINVSYNLMGFFSILFLLIALDLNLHRSQKIILTIFTVHLIICLLEIETNFRWPISKYSSHLNLFFKSEPADLQNIYNLQRPTSFFWNPNNCLLVTLLGFPFVTFLKIKPVTRHMLLTLITVVILLGASRGIIILFTIACVGSIFILVLRKRFVNCTVLIVSLLFGFTYFSWSKTPYQTYRMHSALNLFKINLGIQPTAPEGTAPPPKLDNSTSNRFLMQKQALHLLKSNWIAGLGPGNLANHKYRNKYGSFSLSSIHNYWLEIAAEYGLFFTLIYLSWLAHCFTKLSLNALKNKENDIYITLIFSLALLTPGVLVISSAKYFLPKWIIYGLTLHTLSYRQNK